MPISSSWGSDLVSLYPMRIQICKTAHCSYVKQQTCFSLFVLSNSVSASNQDVPPCWCSSWTFRMKCIVSREDYSTAPKPCITCILCPKSFCTGWLCGSSFRCGGVRIFLSLSTDSIRATRFFCVGVQLKMHYKDINDKKKQTFFPFDLLGDCNPNADGSAVAPVRNKTGENINLWLALSKCGLYLKEEKKLHQSV